MALKPTKPIMGGLTQTDVDKWLAWTGGKPTEDWKSLKELTIDYETPNQMRPIYDVKGYNHRKTGLSDKFSKTDMLIPFKKRVWTHLKDNGLDTISYLPDMRKEMSCVIYDHSRYTLDSVREASVTQAALYDKYDTTNNTAAIAFLLDSLTPVLRETISERLEDKDTFHVVWMELMNEIQVQSVERFEALKNEIKNRKPQHYPGQNLESLAVHFRAGALELSNAGQYEHNLTLSMLKIYLAAGGTDNEDYRFELRGLKTKLEDALLAIGYMDKSQGDDHMIKQKLHYKDISALATKAYRKQFDRGEWPPAKNMPDSKAPPSGYGANVAEGWCGTQAEVLAMIKEAGNVTKVAWTGTEAEVLALIKEVGGGPKLGTCHNCGKPGHWSRECTETRQDSRPNGSVPNWKRVAPTAGTPTTKTVNGKTFNWCGKCNRWTTTHDTSSHQGKQPAAAGGQTEANLGLVESDTAWDVCDPSAWHVGLDVGVSLVDIWELFGPYLKLLQFGLLFHFSPVFFDFLVSVLHTVGMHVWEQGFRVVAPLVWILSLFATLWLGLLPFQDDNPEPRWKRRNRQQHSKRQKKAGRGWDPGSIRSHGFHRKYPLDLRGLGHFVRHPPTTDHQNAWKHIHRIMGELQHYLYMIGLADPTKPVDPTTPVHTARDGPGRQGGNRKGRGRGKKDGNPVYRPVPASGHHNMGNRNFTRRQAGAAKNLHKAYVSAASTEDWSQYPDWSASPDLKFAPSRFRTALQAPAKFRNAMKKESTFSIIWDSGASISISPNKEDFVGPITSPGIGTRLNGIVKGLSIQGKGHVMWTVLDTSGQLRALKIPAYYVPQARVRLLSTTSLLQSYPGETINMEAHQLTLSGTNGFERGRNPVIARVNPSNNLPMTTSYLYSDVGSAPAALNAIITTVSSENMNLSEAQKELVRWHNRLGHISYRRIQSLMRSGTLAHSEATRHLHTAACKLTDLPKCAACQFGKQKRRPTPGKRSSVVRDREGVLRQDHLAPGQRISVDHFVCSTKGRLFGSRGKTNQDTMYCGGCIFVDHASSYVHVEFQSHLTTHETLKAKENYELLARDLGIIVQSFLTDNGSAFTSKEFTSQLAKFEQVISFAGTGAHHHNAIAERNIQTIMAIARTMMLHSAIHWTDVADACLWPMAVQHAVFLHNHMPNERTGVSPHDIFTRSRWEQRKFHDLHVWGCPVYCLEKDMHDGKKLPRWKPRSHRTMNMGLSAKHASTVPLVLNLDSGYITSQFNIVFDDWFATIAASLESLPDLNSPEWSKMFGDSTFQFNFDDSDDDQVELNHDLPESLERRHASVTQAMGTHRPVVPLHIVPAAEEPLVPATPPLPVVAFDESTLPPAAVPLISPREPPSPTAGESLPSTPSREIAPLVPAARPQREIKEENVPTRAVAQPLPSNMSPPRRSGRSNLGHNPNRLIEDRSDVINLRTGSSRANLADISNIAAAYDEGPSLTGRSDVSSDITDVFLVADQQGLTSIYAMNGITQPYAFKASSTNPDTLSYDEAMGDVDRDLWIEAAKKEIKSLEEHGTWTEVDFSEATTKILPSQWVFRRKRTPDGNVKSHKARTVARGDLEQGVFETFAPVVAWSTVRLFLVLSLVLDWHTCSIDFSNAFVQAKLEKSVWLHIPRGFQSSRERRTILKLNKSIYGLSVAPKLWYEHLFKALSELGFTASKLDPCLLFKKDMMLVVYCDDVGISAKRNEDVDEMVGLLRQKGFVLTREGSFSEFLGIKFEKNVADGSINMTQKGLIKKIIETAGMTDCNPNWTPASTTPLGSDPDGEAMDETWNYRSIIGMLLYLTTNTRPDLAFAVSQAARFSHNPKKSHATGIKTIIRYLHRTSDKGMIVKPTGVLSLENYVDASFAGNYCVEPADDPVSVKSRTGIIIFLAGCPLIWKSQLQSSIALSTFHSEYSGLSHSMRILIPLRELLLETVKMLDLPTAIASTIHCRVHEDNASALLLANSQHLNNRNKYLAVKMHHFWSFVKPGIIEVIRCATDLMLADPFTKPLAREIFERLRKLIQGW
jgi:transposase InsO family protein